MRVPFVDLRAQYRALGDEIDLAIRGVLERGDFIGGKDVALFESEFAAYVGCSYAVSVGSGLAALELALRAFGIGPGDEVITVANTFVATVFAITAVGAAPVLVDADPKCHTMSSAALEAAITPRTRAVVPVHLYGRPAGMDAIMAVADRHNLVVIEDAAQAHGARYKGRRVGGFGHAGAFSFYPAKNLGAYGDGGMVVTKDQPIAEKIRLLRSYGEQAKYEHVVIGTNSRLDTLQAAVLRVKLRHLDGWNEKRRQHASVYDRLLSKLPVILPDGGESIEHVYHLYVVQVDGRNRVREWLRTRGIETGVHYPTPVHLQTACSGLGYRRGDFPVSESAAARVLSLPMYPELEKAGMEYIADALRLAIGAVGTGG